jgi:hypothetical protein
VEFSLQTDTDAYIVVFDIDTDGFVHLLYPARGQTLQRFSSNRMYNLSRDLGGSFIVAGAKGIEFVFALAVENRDYINEQELRFLADDDRVPADRRFRVTGDPMLAANRIASELVRAISHRSGVTMSFTYFYVEEAVDFPRYLCEDCYEKGEDPYASGMPEYVANADFEVTERLRYPLDEGFVPSEAATLTGLAEPQPYEAETHVTKVYVSYYPRWDHGFYDVSWWYFDPWYWDPWYYTPYPYRWRWGVTIGWGWGWGWSGWSPCHTYFPYYYWGGYHPFHYWWGGYPAYYPGHLHNWRSFRPVSKGSAGGLYAGLNYKGDRDLRTRQFAPSTPKGDGRTVKTSDPRVERTRATLKHPVKGNEPRTIRSRSAPQKDGREKYSQGERRIQTKASSPREQRVITRPAKPTRSYTGNTRRSGDLRGLDHKARENAKTVRDARNPRVDSPSRSKGSKSVDKRTYVPNVRRESVKSGSGRSGQPTGKSSSPASPRSATKTSPSRGKSTSGGKR